MTYENIADFWNLLEQPQHRREPKTRHEKAAKVAKMATKEARASISSESEHSNPPQVPVPTVPNMQTEEMSIPDGGDRFVSQPLSLFGFDTHHGRFPTKSTASFLETLRAMNPVNPYAPDKGGDSPSGMDLLSKNRQVRREKASKTEKSNIQGPPLSPTPAVQPDQHAHAGRQRDADATAKRIIDHRNNKNVTSPHTHRGFNLLRKKWEDVPDIYLVNPYLDDENHPNHNNDNEISSSSPSKPDISSVNDHSSKWRTDVHQDDYHLNTAHPPLYRDLAMKGPPSSKSASHSKPTITNPLAIKKSTGKKSTIPYAEREEAFLRSLERSDKQLQKLRNEDEKRAGEVSAALSEDSKDPTNDDASVSDMVGSNGGEVKCESKAEKNALPKAREGEVEEAVEKIKMTSRSVESSSSVQLAKGEKTAETVIEDLEYSIINDIQALNEVADEYDWVNLADDGTESDRSQSPFSWEEWCLVGKGSAVSMPVLGV